MIKRRRGGCSSAFCFMNIDDVTFWFDKCTSDDELCTKTMYYYGFWSEDIFRSWCNLFHLVLYILFIVIVEWLIFDYLKELFDKGGFDMKRFFCIMAAVLIVLLSVPSVPVLADQEDPSGIRFYTTESVDGFFTGSIGTTSKEDIAYSIYTVPNSFVTSDIVTAFNNFPSDPNNGNSSPLTSGYWFVCVNSSLQSMIVFWPLERYNNVSINWASGSPLLTANSTGDISFNACFNTAPTTSCYMMQSSYNFSTDTWSSPVGYLMSSLTDQDNIFNFRVTNLYGNSTNHLLSCSDTLNSLYSETQYQYETQGVNNTYLDFITSVYTSKYNYVNFLPATLPYYDGSEIITPDGGDSSEVESNENHMYFKSCDIGFAEPSGVNSYNSFGGAYFYIKYSVDDWVRTHINDYDLYFSSTALVGSRQVNGSKRVSLDSDGCICIPFSDIFSGNSSLLSEGFVVATSNSRVEQNFYKSYLYSVSSEKLPSLLGKFSSVDNNTLSGAWDKLLDVYFGNWLLAYTSSGFTQVITDSTMSAIQSVITYYANFKIQTQCYLIDNNDNRSGSVGRIFDLATGSDTSTDNDGLTNDNPFVDNTTGDDYLPDIPTENTYPVSTGQNGTYIQNNLSIPSAYTVTYRDGVNEFIDWYNQDSSVTGIQNTVWGAFGVFRDNPATDLYEEYFGFLPEPFKQVIFGCGTIGIVGGAACVLRKRLMK